MKKHIVRGLSFLLALSMILGVIPALDIDTHAVTLNQQNIADRADFFFNTTWVCQKTVNGWRDQYTFSQGETYRLPYGQPVNSGKFIGYGVELEDFVIAAADANSVFYKKQSEFNGWTSVYYATDCAAFVAMCWGTVRQDCSTLPYYSTYKGAPTESNIRNILQLGDALDSTSVGHVVLVTDMTYDNTGKLIQIEITEQTPPQLKRTYFTPSELADKYAAEFGIYRYEGSVPAVPEWGYPAQCTNYAAYCQVDISAEAAIMNLPCQDTVDPDAAQIGTAAVGESYVATRLYENTLGELWYRIALEDDREGYILADSTIYREQLVDDIGLSDVVYPNAHVRGKTFSLVGNLYARYNQLVTAYAHIYTGFGTDGTKITGSSDYVTSNAYTLKSSQIDYNTSFGSLTLGKHTMAIGITYKNHYVQDGVICENSDTVELDQGYFMVVSSSTNQSSCSHSYTQTVMSPGSCTVPGVTVHACSRCGHVYEEATNATGHDFGQWMLTEPGCTTDGSGVRSCKLCSAEETQVLPATGHRYTEDVIKGSCQEYPRSVYTCEVCGDSYTVYPDEIMTPWQDTLPEGVEEALIETKQQYRFSDLEEITSPEKELEGYTLLGEVWAEANTETLDYVKEWPTGFDVENSLYAQYNKSPLTEWETDTAKLKIDADQVTGYLYYHWCYNNSYYSSANSSFRYNIFHAYYSTTKPETYRVDTSDWSYCTADSGCPNSEWYFVVQVNSQSFTEYEKLYRQGRWQDYSEWSDTQVDESDTRKVEIRTVYRYADTNVSGHQFETVVTEATCTDAGNQLHTCSVCGYSYEEALPATGHSYEAEVFHPSCTEAGYTRYTCSLCGENYTGEETDPTGHTYADGICTVCGAEEPVSTVAITPKYPTLFFEDEISIGVYFEVANAEGIPMTDMGLISWTTPQPGGTVETAASVSSGAYLGSNGYLTVKTAGIPAKNLSDTAYFKIYIKLADGSYLYSSLLDYSPKTYADNILARESSSVKMKALVVSMLNYGAQAQVYFDYKAYSLMNSGLTDEQTVLVDLYDPGMVNPVVDVDAAKAGSFAATEGGFSRRYPSITFEGAFSIKYYFTPDHTVAAPLTMYVWNEADYKAAPLLTADNATQTVTMTGETVFEAVVSDIAAKDIDRTIFVSVVYTDAEGQAHCSGILNYSLGAYCVSKAGQESPIAPFAAATAVYGYYAKSYFNSI